MSAATYTGHLPNSGGLQGHSIGAEYPYIVEGVQQSADGPVRWRVLDSRNGQRYTLRPSYAGAQKELEALQRADRVNAYLAEKGPIFTAGWRNWYSGGTEDGNPYRVVPGVWNLDGDRWLEGHRAARADAARKLTGNVLQ